jgi:hypothetical protein
MFCVFVAFVSIVVLADNPTEAILYLALVTNFLVAVSILSKWNKVSPGYVPGDGFEDSEAKSIDSDVAPAVSFRSSPTSPPEGFDEKPLPAGILAADNTDYDALSGIPAAAGSEYGPEYKMYDTLRQNHLDLNPAKKFPAELFSTGDADTKFAMDAMSRNRHERNIVDRLARDNKWYEYLYDNELKYNENLHWMSQYEY